MKKRFIISDVAEVLIKDIGTGEVKYRGEAKAQNYDEESDEIVTFQNKQHSLTLGFSKDDEEFQKFIDQWNNIGCQSFSREVLGDYQPRESAYLESINDEIVYEENPKAQQLYDTVIKFMHDQRITCEEVVYQTDRVIENAYDFITDLFNVVKDDLEFEEGE